MCLDAVFGYQKHIAFEPIKPITAATQRWEVRFYVATITLF